MNSGTSSNSGTRGSRTCIVVSASLSTGSAGSGSGAGRAACAGSGSGAAGGAWSGATRAPASKPGVVTAAGPASAIVCSAAAISGSPGSARVRLGRALELASATDPGRFSVGASPGAVTGGGVAAGGAFGSRACGSTTTAVTPLPFCSRSWTRTPWRAASSEVTWRPRPAPSALCSPASKSEGSPSRVLSSPMRTDDMPMPSSCTESITSPVSSSQPESWTLESGGEKAVAFSRSSATRWLRSSAANPAIWACGGRDWMVTRSYRSISLTAARNTSTSGIGPGCPCPCSAPARTSMFSLWRRMTVAMWSSLNSVPSRSGSCSRSSRDSMTPSWRSTRPRVRSERLTKVWWTVFFSFSSWAARSAVWTWSSARWRVRASRPAISSPRSLSSFSKRPLNSWSSPCSRPCRALMDRTTWANSSLRPV